MSATANLPIVIAEWPKNGRGELVRVTLDEFKGRATFDARVWFEAEDGTHKPTKSGLTIALSHLPRIAEAVTRALAEALRRGLPAETGEQPATDEGRP